MSDGSGLIDTSGDTPSIRAGALATTLLGTIVYGAYVAVQRMIGAVGGGITSTIDSIEYWLSGDTLVASIDGGSQPRQGIVDLLFGGLVDAGDVAVEQHTQWLATLGLVGQVVAFVEVLVVVYVILVGTTTAGRWVVSAI